MLSKQKVGWAYSEILLVNLQIKKIGVVLLPAKVYFFCRVCNFLFENY